MRQATLYHYFRTKDDILEALLATSVTPTLAAAQTIRATSASPAAKLHAVATFDGKQLWTSRWNVGVLYLLPELRTERFLPFVETREQLRTVYRQLAQQVLDGIDDDRPSADEDIPLRLVETLVNLRWDGVGVDNEPVRTADAVLRALGWHGDWARLRRESAQLAKA